MPQAPDDRFAQYLAALIALYIWAEEQLLGGIAGILRITAPELFAQLIALGKMQALAAEITRQLAIGQGIYLGPLVQAAIEAGETAAGVEIARAGFPPIPPSTDVAVIPEPFDFSIPHGERSAQAIFDDLSSSLEDVRWRITRLPDDVYKVISPAAAAGQALGRGYTPAQAQAYAWREYVKQGITGFTDKAGRNWSLSAYVEMSVRTATMRAYNDSHLQVMKAAGIDLFTVSDDGHPCPLCFPYQNRILSEAPDERAFATIAEATAGGLFHPNCFPGYVPVSAPSGVSAADSRWYEGDLVVIHTAAGNELSVTPNHPVLTPEGWVNAGDLVVGQDVVSYDLDAQRVDGMSPDDQQVEARIGDVFDALRHSSGVTTVSVPPSAEQFHGDGGNADVEVVLVDRLLEYGAEATGAESIADHALFVGGVRFASLLPSGPLDQVLTGASHALDGGVGLRGEGQPLCARHAREALGHGQAQVGADATAEKPRAYSGLGNAEVFADLALGHSGFSHADGLGDALGGLGAFPSLEGVRLGDGASDSGALDAGIDPALASADTGRDLARRLASDVSADRIISVSRESFAGHVYNLQSGDGWYVASSIVVHNCKHVLTAVIPGITVLPEPREWTQADADAYALTQKQRRLELEIRKAKKQLEYAIDPDARARAKADVRRAQARMRAFIDQSGFLRQSRREQLDLTDPRIKLPTL